MVIDHQRTAIMDKAHGALCGKLRESDGTVINNEGRAQRFFEFMTRRTTTATP